jgi:hypothetical protein
LPLLLFDPISNYYVIHIKTEDETLALGVLGFQSGILEASVLLECGAALGAIGPRYFETN